MKTTAPMVEAIDLSRNFNGKEAVDGVSFNVHQGEIFGLLRPK